MFKEICANTDCIFAPDIYPSEITNVFWKYRNFSSLDTTICEKGIEYCIELIDDFIQTKLLCNKAYKESIKYRHPVYDMFYLIVAQKYNAKLLTRDKKLAKISAEMNIEVISY
nr:type II toxin-antitoxin system VapC family toxin [uncultured Treponema sp.]